MAELDEALAAHDETPHDETPHDETAAERPVD